MVAVSRNFLNAWKTVFGNNKKSNDYDIAGKDISVREIIWDLYGLEAGKPITDKAWKVPFKIIKITGVAIANSARLLTEFLPLWASKYFSNLYKKGWIKDGKRNTVEVTNDYDILEIHSEESPVIKKSIGDSIKQTASSLMGSFFLGLYLAGRAVTSPRDSIQKAWEHGKENGGVPYAVFLTALSFGLTTAVYIVMLPFAIKGFAFFLPEVIVSAVNSAAIFLASQSFVFAQIGNAISSLLMPVLSQLGITITPTLWLYAGAIAAALNLGFLLERAYKNVTIDHGIKIYKSSKHTTLEEFERDVEELDNDIDLDMDPESSAHVSVFSRAKNAFSNLFGSWFASKDTRPLSRVPSSEEDAYVTQTTVVFVNANTAPPAYAPPTPQEYAARQYAYTQYGSQSQPPASNYSQEIDEGFQNLPDLTYPASQPEAQSANNNNNSTFGEDTYYGEQSTENLVQQTGAESENVAQLLTKVEKQMGHIENGERVRPQAPARNKIPQAWEEDIYSSDVRSTNTNGM